MILLSAETPSVHHKVTPPNCAGQGGRRLQFEPFRTLTARAQLQWPNNFEGDHASVQTTVFRAVEWGAARARAPPLCIVSALFPPIFSSAPESFRTAPPAPKHWKSKQILFSRIFLFSVFWVSAFPRKPSPMEHSVSLVPSQTQNHSHKTTQRTMENATMQVNCCCWLPHQKEIHQCRRCVWEEPSMDQYQCRVKL